MSTLQRTAALQPERVSIDNENPGVLTPPAGANRAIVDCEAGTGAALTGTFRFRLDGQTPTSSTGAVLNAGERKELIGRAQLEGFRAFTSQGTVHLNVLYYAG